MRRNLRFAASVLGLVCATSIFLFWARRSNNGVHEESGDGVPKAVSSGISIPSKSASPSGFDSVNRHNPSVAAKAIARMLNAPIEFYGKVIDQYGQPIEGARAFLGAADQILGKGSDYTRVSDENGFFSITGIGGAYLTVSVSKIGYDRFFERSNGTFRYGKQDPRLRPAPSKDKPAVFVLRKKAEPEPLTIFNKAYGLRKDGTPLGISMKFGHPARQRAAEHTEIKADVTFQCWVDSDKPTLPFNKESQYDWRFRISVPGGGVQERIDPEWQFEAPEEGYQPYLEVNMSKDLPDHIVNGVRWYHQSEKHVFVRLSDGRFGRLHLRIFAVPKPFVNVESFTNPKPGSRNLEFDESEAIRSPF